MRVCSSTIGWGVASLVGIIVNTVLIGFNVARMSVEVLTALSFLYALQCLCVGGCWLYSWGFPLLTIFSFMCMSWLGIWTITINKGEDESTPSPTLIPESEAVTQNPTEAPTDVPTENSVVQSNPQETQPSTIPPSTLPPSTEQPSTEQPAATNNSGAEQFRNYCH